jgi:proteasome alpha subunit
MIEEPYRWVEAIANRREYIETQLASGSPIAAISCRQGIVLVTVGRARQKLFEIYDRIAMGAIGHPGDIERLRLAAIELASTEGFTRSAADVSLRRLAYYSLSPVLKAAFEQVYGAPYLARMLFAEIGATPDDDLFVRVEYDGAIATNAAAFSRTHENFGAISGTRASTEAIERFLQKHADADATLERGIAIALDAWAAGMMAVNEDGAEEAPEPSVVRAETLKQLEQKSVEAVLLERASTFTIRYRAIADDEVRAAVRS